MEIPKSKSTNSNAAHPAINEQTSAPGAASHPTMAEVSTQAEQKHKTNFIAIYDRYGVEGFWECFSEEEAIRMLKFHDDSENIIAIAIISAKTNKIVWFNDFLGWENCRHRVKLFNEKRAQLEMHPQNDSVAVPIFIQHKHQSNDMPISSKPPLDLKIATRTEEGYIFNFIQATVVSNPVWKNLAYVDVVLPFPERDFGAVIDADDPKIIAYLSALCQRKGFPWTGLYDRDLKEIAIVSGQAFSDSGQTFVEKKTLKTGSKIQFDADCKQSFLEKILVANKEIFVKELIVWLSSIEGVNNKSRDIKEKILRCLMSINSKQGTTEEKEVIKQDAIVWAGLFEPYLPNMEKPEYDILKEKLVRYLLEI
ncbi:MAG: hypothetical protein F6J93_31320 [Oscillatoria sp. SIO1A7]|nr:hypothetical protein [Oscillatoria sp. SIO1A7]